MKPHHCSCSIVSSCSIYVHPSPSVQKALNALMDEMAVFDEKTGAVSRLTFRSKHRDGLFTSVTGQRQRAALGDSNDDTKGGDASER